MAISDMDNLTAMEEALTIKKSALLIKRANPRNNRRDDSSIFYPYNDWDLLWFNRFNPS
jgi:hypothetical protein